MMKEAIYDYVTRSGANTLIEMRNNIKGAKGEYVFGAIDKNIIFWTDLSNEFIQNLTELIKEEKIVGIPSSRFIYMIDGGGLSLPIAKQSKTYKNPRWLPIVFWNRSHFKKRFPKSKAL